MSNTQEPSHRKHPFRELRMLIAEELIYFATLRIMPRQHPDADIWAENVLKTSREVQERRGWTKIVGA